jgi:hypothetical protein
MNCCRDRPGSIVACEEFKKRAGDKFTRTFDTALPDKPTRLLYDYLNRQEAAILTSSRMEASSSVIRALANGPGYFWRLHRKLCTLTIVAVLLYRH